MIRRDPSKRVRTRASSSSSRRSRLLGPGLTWPPLTAKTPRRQPDRGACGWARSRVCSVSSAAVRAGVDAARGVEGELRSELTGEVTADADGAGGLATAPGR
jgi:hypothetical protein